MFFSREAVDPPENSLVRNFYFIKSHKNSVVTHYFVTGYDDFCKSLKTSHEKTLFYLKNGPETQVLRYNQYVKELFFKVLDIRYQVLFWLPNLTGFPYPLKIPQNNHSGTQVLWYSSTHSLRYSNSHHFIRYGLNESTAPVR